MHHRQQCQALESLLKRDMAVLKWRYPILVRVASGITRAKIKYWSYRRTGDLERFAAKRNLSKHSIEIVRDRFCQARWQAYA